MTGQIEKVKKLKSICLIYTDGTVLKVPETKTLKVGNAFVRVLGDEEIEWEIGEVTEGFSLFKRIKNFFTL